MKISLAQRIERAAQRVYDLRDEAPASDEQVWRELNRTAKRLSMLAGSVAGTHIDPDGIDLIAIERDRQQDEEGWTLEHDDVHDTGELAMAAACYASPLPFLVDFSKIRPGGAIGDPWLWPGLWDKRAQHDPIRRLVIAGALIAAEIDRLQRKSRGTSPVPLSTGAPASDCSNTKEANA